MNGLWVESAESTSWQHKAVFQRSEIGAPSRLRQDLVFVGEFGCVEGRTNAKSRPPRRQSGEFSGKMISISHNWLFIHIPRTGGNSVQSVLVPYSDDHLTQGPFQDGIDRFEVEGSYTGNKHFRLQDYADTVPPEIFSNLFKFTVVRNPWARAISWFFIPLKWISAGRQPRWSVSEFRRDIEHMPSMARMVNVNGIFGQMDMLLRFETLESDFAALTKRLGIEIGTALPHKNKGYSSQHWQQYYLKSPDLVDFIAERFAEDIQMFGYDATSARHIG
jgi:sulfotransferase famil protein